VVAVVFVILAFVVQFIPARSARLAAACCGFGRFRTLLLLFDTSCARHVCPHHAGQKFELFVKGL
jgi:hypothetical protein